MSMAEVFVTFNDTIIGDNQIPYRAQACGHPMDDGRWEGWIEFEALDGSGVVRTQRETTQPNRTDTAYWATGLTPVYLDGALHRALHPTQAPPPAAPPVPAFDGPAPAAEASSRPDSVLNPFSVYRKGEMLLRNQLGALAAWHLVNIVQDYGLSDMSRGDLDRMSSAQLIELIVAAVRTGSAEEITP
jgi:hypothetical protein